MDEMVEKLEKFGLSVKEARVYIANLELGDSTASDLAVKSGLPRTLVYDILERLINLGIVSYSIKENKKYFIASDPHELLRILKEKEIAVQDVMGSLIELKKMKGQKRPRVEIYEGKEGMKTLMNEILKSNIKEFFAYGSSKGSIPIIPAFIEEWHEKRSKKGIFFKVIYNDSEEARSRVKEYSHTYKHADYRFMPIKAHSPTATLVYGNFVVLQSWTKDPFAVVVESEEMAKNQKSYFEELWKVARKQ